MPCLISRKKVRHAIGHFCPNDVSNKCYAHNTDAIREQTHKILSTIYK